MSGAGRRSTLQPYSSMQLLFLLRLVRMLRLKQKYEGLPATDRWIIDLISRSIYSTYCDCLEQGVGTEAQSLMSRCGIQTER